MSENPKKQIPGVIDRLRVVRNGLGHGLIDCFVEPCKVLYICTGEPPVFCRSLLHDARPERAILRHHLINVEPVSEPQRRVNFCCTLTKCAIFLV
jgi:hypothetical protein